MLRIKFSILIASYNRPGYLRDCITSILESDYHDYEIIISDDNSPRIKEIESSIESYGNLPFIHFIKQSYNIGMAENWNYLVNAASGDYILLLGDDDKIYPHTLTRLNEYIEKHQGYNLYAFGYDVIDECDRFKYYRYAPQAFNLSLRNKTFLRHFLISDIIPFWAFHPFTICYEKKISKEIKYNKDALIGADLLFLYECINAGKNIFIIPEVLFSWRKIYKENNKGVQNLSLKSMNNINARQNIFHILSNRKDLDPYISKIISSSWYKNRFLLDARLDISPFNKYKIRFTQMINFIYLFGSRGILFLFKFVYQYFSYLSKDKK